MKKRLFSFFLIIGLILLAGCSARLTPVANTVNVTNADLTPEMKEGKACDTRLFGFIPLGGKSSIVAAAKDGGVTSIKAAEYESNFYFIVTQDCVVVYGD